MLMKVVVVFVLLLIVASLGSAMVYIMRDSGQSTRSVKALSIRVGLSLLLFAMLFVAYFFGWITPHGLYPK